MTEKWLKKRLRDLQDAVEFLLETHRDQGKAEIYIEPFKKKKRGGKDA